MDRATLVLNGEINRSWLGKSIKDSNVYCTDGAYNGIKDLTFDVKAIIGDMDSLSCKPKPGVEIIHMPNQDYTDFEKALQYLSKRFSGLDIYSACGGEMDHFLGNLSAAKKYKDSLDLIFHDPTQHYFFMEKVTELIGVKGKIISILPFPSVKGIISTGLKYPLNNNTLELGEMLSIRNKAKEDSVKISFEKGCAILFVED